MPRAAPAEIRLTPEEEATLRSWTRKSSGEQRLVGRARIILMSHEGVAVEKVAQRLHTRTATLSKCPQRFSPAPLNAPPDAAPSPTPAPHAGGPYNTVVSFLA